MSNLYFREIHSLKIYHTHKPTFPPHLHQNLEIVYVLKGQGDAYCDGEHYFLKPGDAFIAYPNQVHSFSNFTEGTYVYVFMIPQNYLEDFSKLINGKHPVSSKVQVKNKGQLAALFNLANTCNSEENNFSLKYYARIIFSIVSESLTLRKADAATDIISQTLDYCYENFRSKISLKDISDKLYISRSTVSRIFAKKVGMSFIDYVNSLRLSEFLAIIQKDDISITEAATLAGFPTIRTFNGAFKKQYGMTPSEYIKKMKY